MNGSQAQAEKTRDSRILSHDVLLFTPSSKLWSLALTCFMIAVSDARESAINKSTPESTDVHKFVDTKQTYELFFYSSESIRSFMAHTSWV